MSVKTIAAQAEFEGFPESKAKRRENPVSEYLRVSFETGGLIPQSMLPIALQLSKQRISQLVLQRRFEVHCIDGANYVTARSFASFLETPRKTGRPRKPITLENIVQATAKQIKGLGSRRKRKG